MRYRLYSRLGLSTPLTTQVLGLSLVTNWLGYALVAGAAFALRPPELPESWALGSAGLRVLGGVLVACALAYVGICFGLRRRRWTIRRHRLELPSGPVALWQLGVSAGNWALIGGVMYLLLRQHVPYAAVLSTLLVAAIAGVITHVPAGLGVIEAVFVALLSARSPQAELIAALLAYRAIYYVVPLAVAALVLLRLEVRAPAGAARRSGRRSIAPSSYTHRAGAVDHENAREDERHVTSGGRT
ncbi:MAG TPA: lysylphosphatidylglycerol synthase domain-containing protein [Burkholderiaceae bacterium]|nr:lysylphosphatidylglycerol synthase domain-containing protein [Burkholderiaceae bacterium]